MAAKKKKPAGKPTGDWSERLKAIRASHGWNQAQLAARLRLSQSQVSAFESGARQPSRSVAFLIELLETGHLPKI